MKQVASSLRAAFRGGMVPLYALVGPGLALVGVVAIIAGNMRTTPVVVAGHDAGVRMLMGAGTADKPPTRGVLGRSGWTLIHSVAANYPELPSARQRAEARALVGAMAALYPCATCRDHFARFVALQPPDVSGRAAFLLWTCKAHNAVNTRNGKRTFPCVLKELDKRWGDCGCQTPKLKVV